MGGPAITTRRAARPTATVVAPLTATALALGLAACSGPVPDTRASLQAVRADGRPIAALSVTFSGADGRLLAHQRTDAEGRAEGPMEDGGSITHYLGFVDDRHALSTVTGVGASDALTLTVAEPPADAHRVRVQLPAAPAGAAYVRLWNGCDETDVDVALRRGELVGYADCSGRGTEVLAYAVDPSGLPLAYARARHPRADVAVVSAPRWSSFTRRVALTLVGAPPGTVQSSGSVAPARDRASFGRYLEDFDAGPQPRLELGLPADFADDLLVTVSVRSADGFALSQWVASATTTEVRADGSQVFLPAVRAVVLDAADASPRTLSWIPDARLEVADTREAELAWARGRWSFRVPPGATRLVIPELPAVLDAEPDGFVVGAVVYRDYLDVEGEAAVRDAPPTADLRRQRSSGGYTPR